MAFYKDHYDVVVIGGALAGMSCAMKLASEGKSVLVLEQHNLPGGIATSFVRSGVEMEATLHEMMSIGPKEDPLFIRKYLDDLGVVIDVTLHAGKNPDGTWICADEIEKLYAGQGKEVNKLMDLCWNVYQSVIYMNDHTLNKLQILKDHEGLAKTAGYTAEEVMDKYVRLHSAVKKILSAYWIYVGQPIETLPFTIYAFLMGDYMGGGSYVARGFSHEMSAAMADRCQKLGVQMEFCQKVEKILVRDGRVYGVRTAHGEEIHCDYVASSAYPNTVYGKMIEPQSEVPAQARKFVNAMPMSVSCFSVVLLLDEKPEDLNIHDYSVFSADTSMNTEKFWQQGKQLGNWDYLTTICLNFANPEGVPEGTTSLSITNLPLSDCFDGVTADNYFETKRRVASRMIDQVSRRLGVSLKDHILDIEFETPVTISHYTGDYRGGIYGYQHNMQNSIVARLEDAAKNNYIHGLVYTNSTQLAGDGMAVNINNGRIAATMINEEMKEDRH